MPFMTTSGRIRHANRLGELGDDVFTGSGTSAADWAKIGVSLFQASAPLIQTFVPQSASSNVSDLMAIMQKQINPAPAMPSAPPPAIPATPS
jgi:hypothetical protein